MTQKRENMMQEMKFTVNVQQQDGAGVISEGTVWIGLQGDK